MSTNRREADSRCAGSTAQDGTSGRIAFLLVRPPARCLLPCPEGTFIVPTFHLSLMNHDELQACALSRPKDALCSQRRPHDLAFAGCTAARWQGVAGKNGEPTLARRRLRSGQGSRFPLARGCRVCPRTGGSRVGRCCAQQWRGCLLPWNEDVCCHKGWHATWPAQPWREQRKVRSRAGSRSTQMIIAVDPLGDRKQDRCNRWPSHGPQRKVADLSAPGGCGCVAAAVS